MGKVGFLYTIGLLFMSLVVLSLALVIAGTEKSSNEKVTDLVKYDRLYDLDSSISRGFREIFLVASGINFTYNNATNNTLFIYEKLPNSKSVAFSKNMTSWSFFLNQTSINNGINSPSDNITINLNSLNAIRQNLPLMITPYDIVYEHITSYGGNTLRITPNKYPPLNFYGYNITINTPLDIQLPSWTPSLTIGSNQDLILKIRVKGPTTLHQTNARIPSSSISHLLVKDAVAANIINISINQSSLFIDNLNPANVLGISTGIMLTGEQTELAKVTYPYRLFNVTLADLDVKTQSKIVLVTIPQ